MSIDQHTRNRLIELGYLTLGDTSAEATERGVLRFQDAHGVMFWDGVSSHHGRAASLDGQWGPVCQKLLDLPRDCGCPDIARADDGTEIEEARWPEECALELEFSCNFLSGMPGLSAEETRQGIEFALAELSVAYESPLNGSIHPALMQEFARVLGSRRKVDQWVLWVGTVKHEVGHALGLPHTPNDPNSVMYPSMRGQWLLNRTDIANLNSRGYSQERPLRLKLVEWRGDNGTHIWARKKALPGSTLAWSMLSSGSCRQRAEQAYDTTISWNRTKINLPDVTPPPSPPPPPPGTKILGQFTAKRTLATGDTITLLIDDNGDDTIPI